MSGTTGGHASDGLVAAYVAGDPAVPDEQIWALEAHLEKCADCRDRMAGVVPRRAPALHDVLAQVWIEVDAAAVDRPAPLRSAVARWARSWAPPSLLPWLLMSVLVTLAALGIDLFANHGRLPSLVLLVAPVAPLVGVAAAWTRGLDPMSELTTSMPRAGLQLVLRRTAAVLGVVIPLLAVAGGFADVSLALCLVPCLAFTLGALALGTVIGVGRAALVLGVAWTVFAVVPTLATTEDTVLLLPVSLPAWGLATLLAAIVVVARADAFTSLRSRH